MKPLLKLSQTIEEILERVIQAGKPDKQFIEGFSKAISELLEQHNLSSKIIFDTAFQSDLTQILNTYFGDYTQELLSQITQETLKTISANNEFYEANRLDLPTDLVQRFRESKDTIALTKALKTGMRDLAEKLRDTTISIFTEAVLTGDIDRTKIQEQIYQKTETSTHSARTQTQLAVSAYNQSYRNQVAENAGLKHYLYNGYIIAHTRPFCRIHVNKVYTEAQISEMRNGMIEPVMIFKGGYRCKHSWIPVDPLWDKDYTPAEGDLTEVHVSPTKSIKVVGKTEQINRLERQIALEKEGYELFTDAPNNDTGFVAEHKSWRSSYPTKRKNEREDLDIERDTSHLLAQIGHEALLNADIKNKIGGNVDIVFDGNYTDLKTTSSVNPRKFEHLLSNSKNAEGTFQSDFFIIRSNSEMDEITKQRAITKARIQNSRHPEITAYILFTKPILKLEKI